MWKNVSLEMVRIGYATVYRDSHAVYGAIKDQLLKEETKAR
jgi:endonuclease YncB( thermonuclease family)